MRVKKEPNAQMNWRPTPEDLKLIQELRAVLGVSDSDILRLGLRCLAKQQLSGSKAAD